MHAIILAATYELKHDCHGKEVPLPLLDLHGEPYLTTLVKKITPLAALTRIIVVTNDILKPAIDAWATTVPTQIPVQILGDGTRTPEDRLGAVGDLVFAIEADGIRDDVLVIGGDNWFAYDLGQFLNRAAGHSPAVVLTRLPLGVDSSRFGVVEIDDECRISSFLEKPSAAGNMPFRASCVYFFAERDLTWFIRFAAENSTRCTPGQFFGWLCGRTCVYGVPLDATWYDLSGSRPSRLRGPNALAFREELRKMIGPFNEPWQRAAASQLQWVSSHDDLLEVLHDTDPNKRIVAAQLLAGIAHLLNAEGRDEVVQGLMRLQDDRQCHNFGYGSSDDEEDAVYVSDVATRALAQLSSDK